MKVYIVVFGLVALVLLAASPTRAELPVYAPINPDFLGGNFLLGGFLLNKAQATDETKPQPKSGGGVDSAVGGLTQTLPKLNAPTINLQLQGGSNNNQFGGGLPK